jgi:hypothetical protein
VQRKLKEPEHRRKRGERGGERERGRERERRGGGPRREGVSIKRLVVIPKSSSTGGGPIPSSYEHEEIKKERRVMELTFNTKSTAVPINKRILRGRKEGKKEERNEEWRRMMARKSKRRVPLSC